MRAFRDWPVRRLAYTSVAVPLLLSCGKNDSARAIWQDVLRRCAVSELVGDVLYMGPSNNVGVGAVWRRQNDGGYGLRWRLADGLPSQADRDRVINPGSAVPCSGNSARTFRGGAGLVLQSEIAPVQGQVASDFSRARQATVSVGSFAWELVVEGPFTQAVNALPAGSVYRRELESGALIASKVLKVSGMQATLEFSSRDVVDLGLQGKYTGTIPVNASLNLNGQWTSATTLTLSAPGEFYIVAELSRYDANGWSAAGGSVFRREPVDAKATAVVPATP